MTIPMYVLDDFLVDLLSEQDFKDFYTQTVGSSLSLFVQVDSKHLVGKTNYIYMANFQLFSDQETNIEMYKSFIDIVVPLKEPVLEGEVLRNSTKKEIEQVSREITTRINHNLKLYGVEVDGETHKGIKLLASVTDIAETKNSNSSKLVLSLTFGVNNKAKGTCKQ